MACYDGRMNTQMEKYQSTVFLISLVSAIVMLALALVVSGFEIYVRWTINKDFTFLGGGELAALTVSGTTLLLGLLYAVRSR